MAVAPYRDAGPDERDDDQKVARYLLGPSQAVVENIAREELEEDDRCEHPEQSEGDDFLGPIEPILPLQGFLIERRRLHTALTRLLDLILAHLIACSRS